MLDIGVAAIYSITNEKGSSYETFLESLAVISCGDNRSLLVAVI